MEVEATEAKLGLDATGLTGFPSKTAETTAQYSDSSCSVKQVIWMKVGCNRSNWSCWIERKKSQVI